MLDIHRQNYLKSVEKIDRQLINFNEIDEITLRLRESKIECVKYNYSLESVAQNFDCFDAFI